MPRPRRKFHFVSTGAADWYDQIEEPVREIVRVLRDAGWNTTCSCGHTMTVELDLSDLTEAERLANFLKKRGVAKFHIGTELFVPKDGLWHRRAIVTIGYWPTEESLELAKLSEGLDDIRSRRVRPLEQIEKELSGPQPLARSETGARKRG